MIGPNVARQPTTDAAPPVEASPAIEVWNELVTVGLLGTDRRDPPDLPPGPVADLVADALRPTPQGRLLAAVAATVVARRCGGRPLASRPELMRPADDRRPMVPVKAARRWWEIVAHWPVLEPEWMAVAAMSGWRPSPDVLVAMLRRHHRSPLVAAAVRAFGGPVASWLCAQVPDLEPLRSGRAADGSAAALRPLPVPAELEELLDGPADRLSGALVEGLTNGAFKWSHRVVLLNTVARIPRRSLGAVVVALEAGRDAAERAGVDHGRPAAPLSLWESLRELATVRIDMLAELEPADGR